MMAWWPTSAPASMTVGGTRVPRDGWYSSTMAVGDILAEGSMEGGSLGMDDGGRGRGIMVAQRDGSCGPSRHGDRVLERHQARLGTDGVPKRLEAWMAGLLLTWVEVEVSHPLDDMALLKPHVVSPSG